MRMLSLFLSFPPPITPPGGVRDFFTHPARRRLHFFGGEIAHILCVFQPMCHGTVSRILWKRPFIEVKCGRSEGTSGEKIKRKTLAEPQRSLLYVPFDQFRGEPQQTAIILTPPHFLGINQRYIFSSQTAQRLLPCRNTVIIMNAHNIKIEFSSCTFYNFLHKMRRTGRTGKNDTIRVRFLRRFISRFQKHCSIFDRAIPKSGSITEFIT